MLNGETCSTFIYTKQHCIASGWNRHSHTHPDEIIKQGPPIATPTLQHTLRSQSIPLLTCHLWFPKTKAPYAVLFVSATTPCVILNTHTHLHSFIYRHTQQRLQSKTMTQSNSPPQTTQMMKVNVFCLWFLVCSIDVIREASHWHSSLFFTGIMQSVLPPAGRGNTHTRRGQTVSSCLLILDLLVWLAGVFQGNFDFNLQN